ncbi:MAG: glycosyltransferase, partial [Rhodospirillaceae bacterium]|nr:glycosyltransferase [Rhodospirillaceae bacterium]
MKILQVMAGAEYGGAEEFYTRLTIALHKTEIEQRVVIRKNEARAQRLIDGGVEPTQMKFGGKLDIKTPWALKRLINDFKPDIVFSWMNRATSMCPANGDFVHIGRLGGYYNLKYYRNCDHLVANTEDIATYLTNNGWAPEKVHYLPNFVGAARVPPIDRQIFYTPKNATLILAMGRLHENKGFDVLMEAVARVPNTYLWLAGEGPLRGELELLAEKLGIKPRTRFLGWRDDPEALFAAADLFICPSRHEPLGNVVIESW